MDGNPQPQPPQKLLDFNEELKALCTKYQYELGATIVPQLNAYGAQIGITAAVQVFEVSPKPAGVPLNATQSPDAQPAAAQPAPAAAPVPPTPAAPTEAKPDAPAPHVDNVPTPAVDPASEAKPDPVADAKKNASVSENPANPSQSPEKAGDTVDKPAGN